MKKLTLLFAALLISACQSTKVKTQEEIDQEIVLKEEIEILKNGDMCGGSYHFASKDMVLDSRMLKKSVGNDGDFVEINIDHESGILTAYLNYDSILKYDLDDYGGAISNNREFAFLYNSETESFVVWVMSNPSDYELINGCYDYPIEKSILDELSKGNLIK